MFVFWAKYSFFFIFNEYVKNSDIYLYFYYNKYTIDILNSYFQYVPSLLSPLVSLSFSSSLYTYIYTYIVWIYFSHPCLRRVSAMPTFVVVFDVALQTARILVEEAEEAEVACARGESNSRESVLR